MQPQPSEEATDAENLTYPQKSGVNNADDVTLKKPKDDVILGESKDDFTGNEQPKDVASEDKLKDDIKYLDDDIKQK